MTTQLTRTRSLTSAPPKSKGRIAEVMTKQVQTIGRDQTLELAHRMMLKHRIRHLPVLEHGELVGMLTERDLYFLETVAGVQMNADVVEDAMSPDTFAVSPDERVERVAAVMSKRKLGSAVVVDEGHVVGIFTVTDALRLLADAPRRRG